MITDHDIVMVGGGGAGLRAAIAIAETNPSLSVAVVSKVYPMRSHTVAAEGGAAAVDADDPVRCIAGAARDSLPRFAGNLAGGVVGSGDHRLAGAGNRRAACDPAVQRGDLRRRSSDACPRTLRVAVA